MKRFTLFLLLLVLAFSQPARVQGEGAPPGLTGGSLATSNAAFTGENLGDYAGVRVAGAGDVNGDGYADLLIGAYNYSNSTGRAYLFLGGPDGWQLDQGVAGADAIYTGEADNSYTGDSVAGAGDVNGDGYADMLIGASGYGSNTGRAYLVLGSANPSNIPLSAADAVYTGEASSNYAGDSVAGAGDVNGDGYADLLIGAYGSATGRAYLVLGNASPGSINLADADAIYTGEASGDSAGDSVAGAGDVNGDGYADLLVGTPGYSSNTGCAYLVLGSASPGDITLSAADAIYTGEGTGNFTGNSVAGAGDVNGDVTRTCLSGRPATTAVPGAPT
ncbi:MAG TPA: integrin alpha [Anaerolineae bacterium]|nr:integrin alpha [Anaerolineae bacterium]HQI84799.1 integrin alpha [Anaerolineae bacterium]